MNKENINTIRKRLLIEGYEAHPGVNNTLIITGNRAAEVVEIGRIAQGAKIIANSNEMVMEF